MKIIRNISELKDLQEVYNETAEINLSEKRRMEKFEKRFDAKKYEELCKRAKEDNLTQEEKQEHFNMWRELRYNYSTVKNGKVISLESIRKNFDEDEYKRLRNLYSNGDLIEKKDKIKLYKLMQDAQDLDLLYMIHFDKNNQSKGWTCHSDILHGDENKNKDDRFIKTSIKRYEYLKNESKDKLTEEDLNEFILFHNDLRKSHDYIVKNGELISLISLEKNFDLKRFIKLNLLYYKTKKINKEEKKELDEMTDISHILGLKETDGTYFDLKEEKMDQIEIEAFMKEVEKEKLLEQIEKIKIEKQEINEKPVKKENLLKKIIGKFKGNTR